MNTRLAGLEEKSRVLDNDELADALRDRVIELSSRSEKFIPEVLSLLLQLSDRPIQYSKIEDLELFKAKPLPAPLTWAKILEDDPLDNQDGIWDDVDFALDSDEEIKDFRTETKDSNKDKKDADEDSMTSEEETQTMFHDFDQSDLTQEDCEKNADFEFHADQYELIHKNQNFMNVPYWGDKRISEYDSHDSFESAQIPRSIKLTEAQLKREVIFMLLGLPTPICMRTSEGHLNFELLDIETKHMSQEALKHLLGEFAALSDSLATVRTWVRRMETETIAQAFQAALSARMNAVEKAFSDIQSRMLNPSKSSTASLLDLFNEVSILTRVIQQIAVILNHFKSVPTACAPFELLERLFDRTCLNNIIEDAECYSTMASVFFECFHIYLVPVRAWMKSGTLSKHDKSFFIRESDHEVAPDKLWQEQFQLIKTVDGILQAPRFLHILAKKIFTTGKSINFLKRLGQFNSYQESSGVDSQTLDYETLSRDNVEVFTPFSTLFDVALDRWIDDLHQASSHRLREVLETECGLKSSLDALDIVYLNRNGAISGDITKVIFDRIDSNIQGWNDGFLLTELFQGMLSTHSSIEVDRLAVHSVRKTQQVVHDKRRSVKILDSFKVWYDLPWPVANIIKSESINVYQRIFLILNQTQRAKHILQRKHFMRRILSPPISEDRDNRPVYHLRRSLLWFTNLFLTYLTNLVLWVETEAMRSLMTNAVDVDEMIAVHEKYISRLENQCLISKKLAPIHQAVIAILDLSILFSDAHASHQAQLIVRRPTMMTTAGTRGFSNRGRRKMQDVTMMSDSSDLDGGDDEDSRVGVDLSYISFEQIPYAERLKKMQSSFTELISFVITGLYDVHKKAGEEGESCWEMLADNLAAELGREQS